MQRIHQISSEKHDGVLYDWEECIKRTWQLKKNEKVIESGLFGRMNSHSCTPLYFTKADTLIVPLSDKRFKKFHGNGQSDDKASPSISEYSMVALHGFILQMNDDHVADKEGLLLVNQNGHVHFLDLNFDTVCQTSIPLR